MSCASLWSLANNAKPRGQSYSSESASLRPAAGTRRSISPLAIFQQGVALDRYRLAVEHSLVQQAIGDRNVRCFRHFNESETAATSGYTISHRECAHRAACAREVLEQITAGHRTCEIADIQLGHQKPPMSFKQFGLTSGMRPLVGWSGIVRRRVNSILCFWRREIQALSKAATGPISSPRQTGYNSEPNAWSVPFIQPGNEPGLSVRSYPAKTFGGLLCPANCT